MQAKQIYDRNKTRAMEWARQQPNGLRCAICGATGPALTLADTDIFHTCFVARCHTHLAAPPKLRSIYALVLESGQDLDAHWFRENPQRTHRLRHPLPGEYPHGQMLVRKLGNGAVDKISILISGHENPDDNFLRRVFDQARKAGPGKCVFVERDIPGGAA